MVSFVSRNNSGTLSKQQERLITFLTADAKARYDLLQHDYPGINESQKVLALICLVPRDAQSTFVERQIVTSLTTYRCAGSSLEALTLSAGTQRIFKCLNPHVIMAKSPFK